MYWIPLAQWRKMAATATTSNQTKSINRLIHETTMDIKPQLRSYILENFLFSDDQSLLNDSDSFIETGIIDSTGIVEIVAFLEDEFEIQVRPEEMIPDYLDSINRISEFVSSKKK